MSNFGFGFYIFLCLVVVIILGSIGRFFGQWLRLLFLLLAVSSTIWAPAMWALLYERWIGVNIGTEVSATVGLSFMFFFAPIWISGYVAYKIIYGGDKESANGAKNLNGNGPVRIDRGFDSVTPNDSPPIDDKPE